MNIQSTMVRHVYAFPLMIRQTRWSKKANFVFFSKHGSSLWYCHSNKVKQCTSSHLHWEGGGSFEGKGAQTNKQQTSCLHLHACMFKFTRAYQKGTQKWQKSKYYTIKCTRKNYASRAKYYIHFHSLCVTHMHMKVCPTCQPAIMWWAASTLCGFISFKFLRSSSDLRYQAVLSWCVCWLAVWSSALTLKQPKDPERQVGSRPGILGAR